MPSSFASTPGFTPPHSPLSPPVPDGLLRGLNPEQLAAVKIADLSKTFGLTLPEHGHDH